jgi:hypothetical protein
MHGLQWDYSLIPASTRETLIAWYGTNKYIKLHANISSSQILITTDNQHNSNVQSLIKSLMNDVTATGYDGMGKLWQVTHVTKTTTHVLTEYAPHSTVSCTIRLICLSIFFCSVQHVRKMLKFM